MLFELEHFYHKLSQFQSGDIYQLLQEYIRLKQKDDPEQKHRLQLGNERHMAYGSDFVEVYHLNQ